MELSQVQREVLHRLLDKYESRRDYGGSDGSSGGGGAGADAAAGAGTRGSRRTALRVDPRQFPEYFHVSDSSYRRVLNQEMELLEKRSWVVLEWERFDRGHTLRRLVLAEEAVPGLYPALGRRPKGEMYRELRARVERWREKAPPELAPFYAAVLASLSALQPLPPPLKAERPEMVEEILQGVHAFYEPRESEIARRALSVRLYGHSRRWGELEKSILHIIRSYCLAGADAGAGDAALLAERGIVDNPSHIQLAGPLVVATPRGRVDLAFFFPDLGLPAEMACAMEVERCAASAVVTVENKTSYYQYLRQGPPGHLVVYLGGYHNRPRRELLGKLYCHLESDRGAGAVPFYHWGDLDLGGFMIWRDLREKTGIPFRPLYMDEQTYLDHVHRGHPFPEGYGAKLAALLDDPACAPFHALIRLMLQHKIRVEQEAITPRGLD